MKTIIIIFVLLGLQACSSSDDWVCQSGQNAEGKSVQYSINTQTGEMGGYSKCQK